MVKIEIEIPEWAEGKHISIFAGSELLGQMEYNVKKIKQDDGTVIRERKYFPMGMKPADGRCTGCGDCCSAGGPSILQLVHDRVEEFGYDPHKPCPMLDPIIGCTMGSSIPFSCASSNCEGWSDKCTEKLVPINDEAIILEMM